MKSHTAIGFANSLINIIKMQVLLNIINSYTVSDLWTPICSIWGGGIAYCYRLCGQPHTYHQKVQVLLNTINSYTVSVLRPPNRYLKSHLVYTLTIFDGCLWSYASYSYEIHVIYSLIHVFIDKNHVFLYTVVS